MSRMAAFPLIVLFFLLSSFFFSVDGCPPHELNALLTFKSNFNDTQGVLESWKGDECCSWDRVGCSGASKGRHVSKLELGGIGLHNTRGGIDFSLSELQHLTYLDLSGNLFQGQIPFQLGNLSSLRHLDLSSWSNFNGYNLTSSSIHWLSNLSSLEYLSLSGVYVIDNSWGSVIGSLLHLNHLDLSHCFLPAPTIPSSLLNLSSLTFLDLSVNSFSNIPTWMGKLSSLTHLDLSDNNIESILNAIGNLSGLEYFNLYYNALTGRIPSSLGLLTKLTYMDLEVNQLSGPIPSSIGNLLALGELSLGYNQLQGTIPASLGELHKLRTLNLDDNHLSGSLPLSFSKLFSLTVLDVSNNHLNGSIPSALMLPPSVQRLDLSTNSMNGSITEVLFQMSLKMEHLNLSHSGLSINISSTWIPPFQLEMLLLKKCQIGGPIPSWISTQFWLWQLDLSGAQLMGSLPSWLWDIGEVDLSDNHLQGSFTPTSGLSVSYLDLSKNELSGRLPADMHIHLPNVQVLILADNRLEGQIPTSIANLINLLDLDMSINCLTGIVPATLGNLSSLEALNLESNYLEGEIPKELGSLSSLQSLRIGKNSLQGVLSSSLTNLSSLEELDVGENHLTGNIPHWIAKFTNLHVFVIRSNNFTGILPVHIGRMPKLQVIDVSSNILSGTIPRSYFKFPAMLNSSVDGGDPGNSTSYSMDLIVKGMEMHYEYVPPGFVSFDLSNNRLSGHLPPEIDNLKGLMYLNLSMNNLSGLIPESLGNLVQLESLDLSFNKFSGQIPTQLGKLTFLARLNLSYNNLCGRIPQEGGQMLTFDESSYRGNPNLWGCPLQRNCSRPAFRASPPPSMGVEEKREERFEFPWYWMCFGMSVGLGFSGVVVVLMFKLRWRIKCFQVMDRKIEAMDRVICRLPKIKPKRVWG